jgi:hypothetical protein
MQTKEEEYAYRLYLRLSDRFASIASQIDLTVKGSFQQWQCTAKRAQRSCVVHCFEAHGEPEYLASFEKGEEPIASGRTPLLADLIEAIFAWLDDSSLDALHRRFQFVDRLKRELIRIRILY